ncbi:undecaprenyl-phosphate alpha-N-acetylglucosaminyl 1-phosphate transferase [Capsulimonas corticalis]|uniref:Undecaprenyl-phosphate alpha-N-acetylglucosaminyl 1-phosphate transferase n=1 Tax=Capsulimonas corticalis TaxID=2219043 RepID=A0A402D715_9BACT|nr:MraY family glycosyltransferase [Capsulimonas corticalis]BDI29356.1 undecaprenyl-phosphate alpha-N-acetylglucosaminyl 1-phosphate transferase [Capsulimonas corticalis]
MWRLVPIAFALSLALTYLLTPLVRKLAIRFGAVAIPRDRDVHPEPVPRWGGVSMVAAFLLTLGALYIYTLVRNDHMHFAAPWSAHQIHQFSGIFLATALIAIVGALDDKFELSAIWQSLALVASGLILYLSGVSIEGITNPFYNAPLNSHGYDPRSWLAFPAWFSALATVIWVFGVAKTVDFIDGLDGLASGVCAICATTLALMSAQTGQYEVTIIAAAVVGVCVGFLRYNYNPATIIMGTVGAQFLGFVLAAIAIVGTLKIPATVSVLLPLLVLGVPIFDGIRVVTQRAIKRTPAYLPDKTSHIHHILLNKGLSVKRAVWVIYGLTAGLCLVALVIFHQVRH